MTTEQLQAARAEKWRQKANPLLTVEEAETWIDSIGISLFLPRKTQLQMPAPSFTEAIAGETNPTPPPAAIQNAFEMATRLFISQKATPLNLLGNISEQPDFLVSPEALPYVFALRGDRDWKRGPRDKSSPLTVETWKVLKREGALTVPELQNLLGREVTEAAVLRSLTELWGALRVLPIYSEGEATAWELFESRHQKAMQTGGGMAQATALSALISLYLDTVIAATIEEIEIFLSPLAPRSRIGEVVRGLTATRQLLTIPLGAQSLLYIAGGLPEFPVIEPTPEEAAAAEPPAAILPVRRPFKPHRTEGGPEDRRPRRDDRKPADGGWKRPSSERPRREWTPRPADQEQREFRPRRTAASGEFRQRTDEGAGAPRKEWKPRRESEERREFRPRRAEGGFGNRPKFGERRSGAKRPFENREGADRPKKSFGSRSGSKPFSRERSASGAPRKEWKPRREGEERREFRPRREEGGFGDRPKFGERRSGAKRPFENREGAERPKKSFGSRGGSNPFSRERSASGVPRKEWKPRREGEERREFRPRREEGGFSDRPKFGERRSGAKRPFESREGFDRKKPPQRERRPTGESAERPKKSFSKPFSKPSGPFSKPSSRGGKSFGAKKTTGRKPSFGAKRPGGKPSFGKRPNNRKGKKSGE